MVVAADMVEEDIKVAVLLEVVTSKHLMLKTLDGKVTLVMEAMAEVAVVEDMVEVAAIKVVDMVAEEVDTKAVVATAEEEAVMVVEEGTVAVVEAEDIAVCFLFHNSLITRSYMHVCSS